MPASHGEQKRLQKQKKHDVLQEAQSQADSK